MTTTVQTPAANIISLDEMTIHPTIISLLEEMAVTPTSHRIKLVENTLAHIVAKEMAGEGASDEEILVAAELANKEHWEVALEAANNVAYQNGFYLFPLELENYTKGGNTQRPFFLGGYNEDGTDNKTMNESLLDIVDNLPAIKAISNGVLANAQADLLLCQLSTGIEQFAINRGITTDGSFVLDIYTTNIDDEDEVVSGSADLIEDSNENPNVNPNKDSNVDSNVDSNEENISLKEVIDFENNPSLAFESETDSNTESNEEIVSEEETKPVEEPAQEPAQESAPEVVQKVVQESTPKLVAKNVVEVDAETRERINRNMRLASQKEEMDSKAILEIAENNPNSVLGQMGKNKKTKEQKEQEIAEQNRKMGANGNKKFKKAKTVYSTDIKQAFNRKDKTEAFNASKSAAGTKRPTISVPVELAGETMFVYPYIETPNSRKFPILFGNAAARKDRNSLPMCLQYKSSKGKDNPFKDCMETVNGQERALWPHYEYIDEDNLINETRPFCLKIKVGTFRPTNVTNGDISTCVQNVISYYKVRYIQMSWIGGKELTSAHLAIENTGKSLCIGIVKRTVNNITMPYIVVADLTTEYKWEDIKEMSQVSSLMSLTK